MRAAARYAPGVVRPRPAPDVAPVRVAVVGTGEWWGRHHAELFAGRADTSLVAVVGRDPDRTAARAAEFGAAAFVDLDEMLERARPDLVTVCLPNERHYEPTLRLIRAGVPLLLEKPLVFAADEADILVAEAARWNPFVGINFNHRYAKPVRLAVAAVERGDLGRLAFATWRFGGEPGTSRHPHANLIETQCHGLDLLEHLCGPIESVVAQLADPSGHGWSTLVVAARFGNGAVGSLVGSYDSSYAYQDTHRVELNGTAGRILIDDTVRRYSFQRAEDETAHVWQAGYFNDTDRSFHATFDRHVDELLAALRAGAAPPVPIGAGRRALRLADAIISSYETGTRISTLL
ncbi:Gfo/Idh/MocA family oxidoreductase [Actinoplanes sp. NEAU-A12]|uniref:Gfo/Idh/MocA family oxidoreductase n=1 Tax=Actinoplanes sandaracinus TaxID=3045177 RepID=A0ABT6WM63_9ACTN|nr:Gfo/Idh/MocA family oxidoreductase [Actinoplanes sandaracinus]MDI6100786.1 Gfo/Idh/MocA family oxidoreductase [Actinoplanes sandaracinus]